MIYINHILNELEVLEEDLIDWIEEGSDPGRIEGEDETVPLPIPIPQQIHEERRAAKLWRCIEAHLEARTPFPKAWQDEYEIIVDSWDDLARSDFFFKLFT